LDNISNPDAANRKLAINSRPKRTQFLRTDVCQQDASRVNFLRTAVCL